MAGTLTEQSSEQRAYRTWLVGFGIASSIMVAGGLALAALNPGLATPWAGLALVVAAGLAVVVGASKTSSA